MTVPDFASATVEVRPDFICPQPNDPRWVAAVVFDRRQSSFDCGHLHKSERTAGLCLAAVERTRALLAQQVADGEASTRLVNVNPDGLHVYETQRRYTTPGGADGVSSFRFHFEDRA